MAARVGMSVSEYLETSFPDMTPDYVDGELVERGMPNNEHAKIQVFLAATFYNLGRRHPLHARSELRVRVSSTKLRVVDLAVYAYEEPTGEVPSQIPLIAIEIVSPDDLWKDLSTKLADYETLGVPNIWLIDPLARQLYVYSRHSLSAVDAFELPEFGVRLPGDQIFA